MTTTKTAYEIRAYRATIRHAVETGEMVSVDAITKHYGVDLVRDADSAALVTDTALVRHVAEALAYDLRHGAEAPEVSVAVDNENSSLAWVYVTIPED